MERINVTIVFLLKIIPKYETPYTGIIVRIPGFGNGQNEKF